MTLTRNDRIIGCLLGGALGDAIGAPFEGSEPQREFVVPESLRITDDTQLTLATCEAIIETGSVDPECVARHFLRWFRERRLRGLGSSTLKSLTELDAGGHWALVGATGERAAGSGAAMRIAPLAFFLDPDSDEDRQTIRDVCRITHRNDEAYVGALAIVRALRHVMDGGALDEGLIPIIAQRLPDSLVRDRLVAIHNSRMCADDYVSGYNTSGFVADAVPLAILAACEAQDFMPTISWFIRLGGDTDTIASLYGQIIGAYRGTQGLPLDIVESIEDAAMIRDVVRGLLLVLAAN